MLVSQDDPEKRITDLERQLAEQKRGADLPLAGSDRAQPGLASNSDPAQRRFVARIIPNARQNLITWGLLSAGAVVLLVGGATLTLATPTNPALIPIVMLVGLVALVALALLALRRLWAKKVVICVTAEGLTVDQRPDHVFRSGMQSWVNGEACGRAGLNWRAGRFAWHVARTALFSALPIGSLPADYHSKARRSSMDISTR